MAGRVFQLGSSRNHKSILTIRSVERILFPSTMSRTEGPRAGLFSAGLSEFVVVSLELISRNPRNALRAKRPLHHLPGCCRAFHLRGLNSTCRVYSTWLASISLMIFSQVLPLGFAHFGYDVLHLIPASLRLRPHSLRYILPRCVRRHSSFENRNGQGPKP